MANGVRDATRDAALITRWWTDHPYAGIGIGTGPASRLIVLEVDADRRGLQSLAKLERKRGKLSDTFKVGISDGGWHFYFAHPGTPVAGKVRLRPGIYLHGEGSYVFAPPTTVGGKRYKPASLLLEVPAPCPAWLLALPARLTRGEP